MKDYAMLGCPYATSTILYEPREKVTAEKFARYAIVNTQRITRSTGRKYIYCFVPYVEFKFLLAEGLQELQATSDKKFPFTYRFKHFESQLLGTLFSLNISDRSSGKLISPLDCTELMSHIAKF